MKAFRLAFLSLALLLLGGCATTKLPLVPIPVPLPRIPFIGGEDLNLARKDWAEACQTLADRMAQDYPYTELKGLNWFTLSQQLVAEATAAEDAQDEAAFYAALRKFVESLHDGNTILSANDDWLAQQFGGSLGLDLALLDDGRVLVASVEKGGPAEAAGIKPLQQVVTWNSIPVAEALAAAPMYWETQAPATALDQRRHRLRGMTRLPVDTEVTLSWLAPEGAHTATLKAGEATHGASPDDGLLGDMFEDAGSVLESRWLNNETGYIKVLQFAPSMTAPFPGRAFKNTIAGFRNDKARHLVLDLRGNSAGLDEFAAELAGYLVPLEDGGVYRDLAVYNKRQKQFALDPALALKAEQHDEPGLAPVLVLVDEDTSRAAETLVWTLKQRGGKSVLVVGDGPTRGITTVPDRTVQLPAGFRITYPIARWLGPDGETPVEARASGEGGIVPDIPVQAVESTLRQSIEGEDLVLQRALDFLKPQSN